MPELNQKVFGAVWKISQSDEACLDRYEGVRNGIYRKQTVVANACEEQEFDALVYVANNSQQGFPRIGYLETILKGIQDFGGSTDWADEIQAWRVGVV